MKAWKKGAIILVFLLALTYFIKIDYPEYEVFEVTFDQSYSDNEINMFCDIVEMRLGGGAFQINNRRIHGALDYKNGENPNMAFVRKMPPEAILGLFLRRGG